VASADGGSDDREPHDVLLDRYTRVGAPKSNVSSSTFTTANGWNARLTTRVSHTGSP